MKNKICFWLNDFNLCIRTQKDSVIFVSSLKCEYKSCPKKCPYYRHPDWKFKF